MATTMVSDIHNAESDTVDPWDKNSGLGHPLQHGDTCRDNKHSYRNTCTLLSDWAEQNRCLYTHTHSSINVSVQKFKITNWDFPTCMQEGKERTRKGRGVFSHCFFPQCTRLFSLTYFYSNKPRYDSLLTFNHHEMMMIILNVSPHYQQWWLGQRSHCQVQAYRWKLRCNTVAFTKIHVHCVSLWLRIQTGI